MFKDTIIKKIDVYFYEKKLNNIIQDARNEIKFRSCVIVKIVSNKNQVGWGEAASFANSGSLVVPIIKFFSKKLINQKIPDPRKFFFENYMNSLHFGRRGLVINALSGIDIALWDLASKTRKIPLFKLLKLKNDKIKYYFNGGYFVKKKEYNFLKNSALFALSKKAYGFKFKIGRNLKEDKKRIILVKKTLGNKIKIMVDANGVLNFDYLLKIDKLLKKYSIEWIEEPFRFENIAILKKNKKKIKTKIAGYELEQTFDGWREIINSKIVDIVQPDAIWSGGISECLKIVNLCEAKKLQFVPHNFASIISLAANAHLAAISKKNIIEIDSNENPFLWQINKLDNYKLLNGLIQIPKDTFGLGVDININSISKYRVL